MNTRYRMYVDEVGNSDLGSSDDPNHRFLSLTGLVFGFEYAGSVLVPRIRGLKTDHFGWHPDDDQPLHRKELLSGKPPFEKLQDQKSRLAFNQALLALIDDLDFFVVTVVIDKREHLHRYRVWRHDPYHYCLEVLLERYVQWLDRHVFVGDVMAESRGGAEDRRLKKNFSHVFENGTSHVRADVFKRVLTSHELKIKPKAANIAGLQIADLIAHPSFRQMRLESEGKPVLNDFGSEIAKILLQRKYHRSPAGKVDGWGRKWLP